MNLIFFQRFKIVSAARKVLLWITIQTYLAVSGNLTHEIWTKSLTLNLFDAPYSISNSIEKCHSKNTRLSEYSHMPSLNVCHEF